jgi:hypothetical protein
MISLTIYKTGGQVSDGAVWRGIRLKKEISNLFWLKWAGSVTQPGMIAQRKCHFRRSCNNQEPTPD